MAMSPNGEEVLLTVMAFLMASFLVLVVLHFTIIGVILNGLAIRTMIMCAAFEGWASRSPLVTARLDRILRRRERRPRSSWVIGGRTDQW